MGSFDSSLQSPLGARSVLPVDTPWPPGPVTTATGFPVASTDGVVTVPTTGAEPLSLYGIRPQDDMELPVCIG